MASVKVSRKYQITIPKDVRKYSKIKPGDKVGVMFDDGVIVVVKVRPMREMRGLLKGIDTTVNREKD
jgi:AbrB family looped-hinge helix DNA binding protein